MSPDELFKVPEQISDEEALHRKLKEDKEVYRILLKYGFIAFPAVAYFLDFTYESGFCSAFDIPNNFIEVNLTTVLVFASSLLAITYLFVPIYTAWDERHKVPRSGYRRLIYVYGPYLVIAIFLLELYGWKFKSLIVWWVLLALMIVVDLMRAGMRSDRNVPFTAALRGAMGYFDHTQLGNFKSALGAAFPIFAAFSFLIFIARQMGSGAALTQDTFLVCPKSPDLVVLRKYGDKIFLGQIDGKNNYTHKFIIVGVTDIGFYEEKKIGTLNFSPLK